MINPIFLPIVIVTCFIFRTLRLILFYSYLWQLKEYRLDRLRDHFSLRGNRKSIFNYLFYLRISLALGIFFLVGVSKSYIFLFIPLLFAIDFYQFIRIVLNRKLFRPVFTLKIKLIITISLLLHVISIYSLSKYVNFDLSTNFIIDKDLQFYYWGLFLISFATSMIVTLAVIILKPITYFQKKRIYKKASLKIKELKDLKVIGITGSYGKTSCKEFLYQVLSKKFDTQKTHKHNNSEIGVAQNILKYLNRKTQFFIAEMGAYSRGEISTICQIAKPSIAIITGIAPQHLSLFGSFENLKKAKYELIESLPKNGLAIFNGDNPHCREMYEKTHCQRMMFSTQKKADVYADQIDIKEDHLSFIVYYKDECKKIKANLMGKQNIPNLLAAICVALNQNMPLPEIAQALESVKPIDQTMQLSSLENGLKIIDDSYNANPDGVISALEYLESLPTHLKKVIVIPSMLELGSKSKEEHIRVGEKIGAICDAAIILDDEFVKQYKTGIAHSIPVKTKVYLGRNQITDLIKQKTGRNAAILFESRASEIEMRKVRKLVLS